MEWSYGVTTVDSRLKTYLPRTLASLDKAGFPNPRLFVDNFDAADRNANFWREGFDTSIRDTRIKTAGNWVLAAWELYIRSPRADRYAIFQDDVVFSAHLREYLEDLTWPPRGYLNLYTFPMNEPRSLLGRRGWRPKYYAMYPITPETIGIYPSNQKGKSACALVFDNSGLQTLLGSRYLVKRFQGGKVDPETGVQRNPDGSKYIDGGIVTAMAKAGYTEFVHMPSLCQHIGVTLDRTKLLPGRLDPASSMGNKRHGQAPSFRGEEFDARKLTVVKAAPVAGVEPRGAAIVDRDAESPRDPLTREAVPVVAGGISPRGGKQRIGLYGYHCRTGIGAMNFDIQKHCDVDAWLIPPHPKKGVLPMDDLDCDHMVCPTGSQLKTRWLLQRCDVIVFVEQPIHAHVLQAAKAAGKRIVCIPMQEWFPSRAKGWAQLVDLFIAPTLHCHNQIKHLVPSKHFVWPVDTDRFRFKQRDTCDRFVFIDGNGGYKNRKGSVVINQVLAQWPEMPLTVFSQRQRTWRTITARNEVGDAVRLYDEGDVLLLPHHVDGNCLEMREAMSCGMPVISTDGSPWDEVLALSRIPAARRKVKFPSRPVDWWDPSPAVLVELCRDWLGKPIGGFSQAARDWAEVNSWVRRAEMFNSLVRGEIPCPSAENVEETTATS